MAGCDGLTFHGVTRPAWAQIKRAASSYGVGGSDSGSASVEGFSFSWSYNEALLVDKEGPPDTSD